MLRKQHIIAMNFNKDVKEINISWVCLGGFLRFWNASKLIMKIIYLYLSTYTHGYKHTHAYNFTFDNFQNSADTLYFGGHLAHIL